MHKHAIDLFATANFFLFGILLFYFDAIEIPNTIGYISLFLSVIASFVFYFIKDRDMQDAIQFGFFLCIILIAIFHNLNFVTASDYRGQYVIEDIRRGTHFRENWRIRLDNQKSIGIRVSEPPSGSSAELQLKKGIFQVYFGTWKKMD
jgi:hypothetical protein